MKTSPDASMIFLGLLIVFASNAAKLINMVVEAAPPLRAFVVLTEPILKVPIRSA